MRTDENKRLMATPPQRAARRPFARELAGYHTGKGSIQFPLDKPLPLALIRRMTALRVKQSKIEDVKWISHGRKRTP